MKYRHEYKHQINLSDIYGLKARLRAIAKHDPHAGEDGTYFIRSLYFDNYMDKALREKLDGVNRREKFRIRYYGTDTSFIRLEKKSKISGLCNKVSCRITEEECRKIIDGDIEFMKDSDAPLMRELYAKMRYQILRPKCIVAYTRECFIYPPGNVRVTLAMFLYLPQSWETKQKLLLRIMVWAYPKSILIRYGNDFTGWMMFGMMNTAAADLAFPW